MPNHTLFQVCGWCLFTTYAERLCTGQQYCSRGACCPIIELSIPRSVTENTLCSLEPDAADSGPQNAWTAQLGNFVPPQRQDSPPL